MRRILCGLLVASAVLIGGAPAQAVLLTGSPSFSSPVFSQVGPIVGNTLAITPLANGFSVAGQVQIQVAPTGGSGILASWQIDYPIDPTYIDPAMFVQTDLLGFSSGPPGLYSTTQGQVTSSIVTLPASFFPGSTASVPMTLTNGIGTPAWNPTISATSSTFSFTATAGMVLRQRFELDGIYLGGPGGIWTVDVPVTTFVTSVPEPSSCILAGMGLIGLAVGIRRRALR